ncbi:nucleotidyltransferase [Formosa sp. A9]|uniref:nucleotidyltransferase n=1 Tax=Formosa sp. A9 TaxID=3442641 RepID=UPI003EB78D96
MRNKQDIKNTITEAFISNTYVVEAYGLDVSKTFAEQFSLVSLENILFDLITNIIYVLELLFDQHEKEVNTSLFEQKNARLPWYRTMSLNFQFGFDLVTDKDYFDNTNATADQIEASKVVKYAAVNESVDVSRVVLKIAGETNQELAPITDEQRIAFNAYVEEFRPAGVQITIINYLPDLLYLNLKIYYDPLVLNANGMEIKTGEYPVQNAITDYMKLLPFDGEFNTFDFLNYIKNNAAGVITPVAVNIETAWIDPMLNDYGSPVSVDVKRIPESGYFKVVNFDNIAYVG